MQLASTLVLRRVTLVRARVGSESGRLRRDGGRAGGSVGCMASGAESFNSVRDGHAAARAAFAVSLHDLGHTEARERPGRVVQPLRRAISEDMVSVCNWRDVL